MEYMQFTLPSSAHTLRQAALVFDIGSGSVGAGVVLVGVAGKESRIAISRRITLSQEDRDEKQLIVAISSAVEKVGTFVLKSYAESPLHKEYGSPQSIYVTVHAPWVRSSTSEGLLLLKAPTSITKELISQAWVAKSEKKEPIPSTHQKLEQMVVRVELNGYPTGNPIGKVASSLRSVVLESVISSTFYSAIEQGIHSILPGKPIIARSAAFTYSRVIKDISPQLDSYLFVDISSEASACSVVQGGTITNLGSVPVGFRTLVRSAAAAQKGTVQETLSMIRLITEGGSTDGAANSIEKAIADAESEYMRAFGEVFSSLSKTERLPNTLFLAIHPKLSVWAKGFFGRIDFSQFTLTGKPFGVVVLSSRLLAPIVVYTKDAHPDSGVGTTAALVHIERVS